MVNSYNDIEEWLFKAVICYYKKELGWKGSMKEMIRQGIGDLILSKFYSKSFIMGSDYIALDQDSLDTLNTCFSSVLPWNKDIQQVM